jgi:hypothetical protein
MCLGSLFMVLGVAGIAFAQPQTDLVIPVPDTPPVIDGIVDEVWSLATKQFMTISIGEGVPTNKADCSGSWQVLYDSKYLYALIDVNDDQLHNDTALADSWQDDSAEFYIDGDNSKGAQGAPSSDRNDLQYRFGWNTDTPTADMWEYFHRPDSLEGVEYMMVETDDGYLLEIKIPWTAILGHPGAPVGQRIGIDSFINDDDDGGNTREHQVAWHSTDGGGWNTPSMWGTALLLAGDKAANPKPPDGAENVTGQQLMQWVAGRSAAFHDVYFGTNPTPGPDEFQGRLPVGMAVYYHKPGLTAGTTYYWRVDEVEADGTTIYQGDVWSFSTPSLKAWKPKPVDGAENVFTDVTLSWTAGWGALIHDVYLGDNFEDVQAGAPSTYKSQIAETTYSAESLKTETTYYWRVDEFDGRNMVKGDIWSFKTVPAGTGKIIREWWLDITGTSVSDLTGNARYPDTPDGMELVDTFEGPVDWQDNYGSRLRGWLFAPMTGDYTFWIAGDDNSELWLSTDEDPTNKRRIASVPGWVPSRDFDNTGGGAGGPEQKSQPQHLVKGQRYYIEALMKDGTGGDNIAVAWTGPVNPTRQIISGDYVGATPLLPAKAYAPGPGNGATDVIHAATLTWMAGGKAAQHDVYFGTDPVAVANADTSTAGIYRGRQNLDAVSYVPLESPLPWNTTYYWRIDEINSGEPESPWRGDVWSFTTANFLKVDDFEDYEDYCNRVFYTWTDGWGYSGDPTCGVTAYGGNGTGSTVGNLNPPFAEQNIIHSGAQSMPFEYDNTGTAGKARYSETQREWTTAQDWTREGIKALTIWYRGRRASVGSFSYNQPTDVYTITGGGVDIWDEADQFHFVYKRLSGVGTIVAKVLSVGNTHAWAKAGVMIRESLDANSVHATAVITPSSGVSFQRRITTASSSADTTQTGVQAPQWVKVERTLAGDFIVSYSADASSWTQLGSAVNINMQTDVYIGLAVTSHEPTAACVAEFSNVQTTGTVTGQWQAQDVGIESNIADQLYVVVQDATGKTAVVEHENPDAVLLDTWQEWNIDLKDLSNIGVNLKSVKKLFLGVGNRTNPAAGGTGKLFFDDIRLYRPRCVATLTKPVADLSNNCVVDYADIDIMASQWLKTAAGLTADLDADGDVDLADYALLADAWLEELLWPQP